LKKKLAYLCSTQLNSTQLNSTQLNSTQLNSTRNLTALLTVRFGTLLTYQEEVVEAPEEAIGDVAIITTTFAKRSVTHGTITVSVCDAHRVAEGTEVFLYSQNGFPEGVIRSLKPQMTLDLENFHETVGLIDESLVYLSVIFIVFWSQSRN